MERPNFFDRLMEEVEKCKDVLKLTKKEYAAIKLFLMLNKETKGKESLTFEEIKEYSVDAHDQLKAFAKRFPNEDLATERKFYPDYLMHLCLQINDHKEYKDYKKPFEDVITINFKDGISVDRHILRGEHWMFQITQWPEERDSNAVEIISKYINEDGTTGERSVIKVKDIETAKRIGEYFFSVTHSKLK